MRLKHAVRSIACECELLHACFLYAQRGGEVVGAANPSSCRSCIFLAQAIVYRCLSQPAGMFLTAVVQNFRLCAPTESGSNSSRAWSVRFCAAGMEPSGQPFNAIVCLPSNKPHNCCVNAGAIMTAAVVVRRRSQFFKYLFFMSVLHVWVSEVHLPPLPEDDGGGSVRLHSKCCATHTLSWHPGLQYSASSSSAF